MKTITIPESIDYIGEQAFYGCSSLENISLPDKGIEIHLDAFCDTDYYTNTSNWTNECLYIGNHMVDFNLSKTEEIKIREGTKSIVFSNLNYENSKIYIPASVEKIFYSSHFHIKFFEVSDENPYFSSSDGVLFDKQKTKLIAYPVYKTAETYTVPESVTEIVDYAFAYSTFLKKIELPDGLNKIGEYAFSNSGLVSVVIPGSVDYISKRVFGDCIELRSVTIMQGVSEIQDSAFEFCTSLESIGLPDSIKYVAPYSFFSCKKLTSIKIPNKVEQISFCCFESCASLEKVELPASLKYINTAAFNGCSLIKEITLPESVKRINVDAFYGCESLKSFTVPESVYTIGNNAFGMTLSETDRETVKKIPDFTLNCYENSAAYDYAVENGINYKIIK